MTGYTASHFYSNTARQATQRFLKSLTVTRLNTNRPLESLRRADSGQRWTHGNTALQVTSYTVRCILGYTASNKDKVCPLQTEIIQHE
jgi:hypothetical protein